MKKKRIAALILSLLLTLSLLCAPPVPAARAAQSIYFTAAGSYILPLSDSTMPFWTGGYLYIPSSTFTGTAREALGVSQVLNSAQNRLVLYSGGRSLTFDLSASYATDNDGMAYYPGAVRRSGNVFVPAYVVARYFDLVYSVIEVERGSLVWIRQPNYNLSEKYYADAAKYWMDSVYADYVRAKEQAQQPDEPEPSRPVQPPAQTTPPQSVTPPAAEDPEPSAELAGKRVYLCLEATSATSLLLDTLARRGVQAAFFCDAECLGEEGDLLRRMTASGHSIGLLADASDVEHTAAEQLAAGNEALALATCGMTRLAYVRNASAQDLRDAGEAGFRCLAPEIDRSARGLRSASSAESLLQRVSAQRGDAVVWVGDASTSGLSSFLDAVDDASGYCLAWTEAS